MTTARNGSARRKRGTLRTLPSGSIQVVVYAGTDPLSGKRHYLEEVASADPNPPSVPPAPGGPYETIAAELQDADHNWCADARPSVTDHR